MKHFSDCSMCWMAVIGEEELLSIPFRWFVYVVAGMPLFALFACIAISVTLHLDEATRTHCGVSNWLPSISAAVASFPPERYIWRLLIALHSAPRYAIAFAFRLAFICLSSFHFYAQVIFWGRRITVAVILALSSIVLQALFRLGCFFVDITLLPLWDRCLRGMGRSHYIFRLYRNSDCK